MRNLKMFRKSILTAIFMVALALILSFVLKKPAEKVKVFKVYETFEEKLEKYPKNTRNVIRRMTEHLRKPNEYENAPRGYLLNDEVGEISKELIKDIGEEVKVPFFVLKQEDLEDLTNLEKLYRIPGKRAIVLLERVDLVAPLMGLSSIDLQKTSKVLFLNKLLAEMEKLNGILFFATTKSSLTLDQAVMRPGRFDHYILLTGKDSVLMAFLDTIPTTYKLGLLLFWMAWVMVIALRLLAGNVNALGHFTKSTHFVIEKSTVDFESVQGCDEVKEQLMQIVDFLKNPQKYQKFGASMPRGYLLTGPPGVGKTMLARAVAGEAKVPFLAVSGAEFEELYVGVGAARVRGLFAEARKSKKAVIFIDEIDAVATKRSSGMFSEQSNRRQTLNQLLVELDGFNRGKGDEVVVVLAATNALDTLDPAILRPGRFDHVLALSPPDIEGRRKILTNLLSKIPQDKLSQEVDARKLAQITIGFTGADLSNLINRAKLIASLDESASLLEMKHFKEAKDFISLGPEREIVMTEEEKERTAFHEAGHAIVALATPGSFPVHQATIVPHSNSLGLVLSSPEKDINHMSFTMLEARIDMTLGGFLAEELKYETKNVSTGASSDLKTANEIARQLVRSGFGSRSRFLQLPTPESGHYASDLAKQNFEDDVTEILEESRRRVRELLKNYSAAWGAIALALIEHENLNREQLEEIFKNNQPS